MHMLIVLRQQHNNFQFFKKLHVILFLLLEENLKADLTLPSDNDFCLNFGIVTFDIFCKNGWCAGESNSED